jgi:peptide/nickel transport system permease protein
MAVLGLSIVVLFYLAALLAPLLVRHLPWEMVPAAGVSDLDPFTPAPPLTPGHVLGTDHLMRDIFSRVLYGAGVSLFIGLVAVLVSVTFGTLLGSLAGYLGGWVDTLVMRLVDLVMAFPRIVLLVAVVGILGRSMFLVILALALSQWPFPARIVRGEILALREREFAEAARALGFSGLRILFRHLLPNAMAPIIVAASLGVGNTILLEAGLSFLNLGVQAPDVSWGTMIADGRDHLFDAWWISTFPGLAIVAVVLGFNLLGDGLRDALDPRQSGGVRAP